MISVLIVENEYNAGEALKKMLPLVVNDIQVIGLTGYVSEAIEIINTHKPDIIFLDIELEDGTGFDVLKRVESKGFKLIFTTAYNQYAIKAFKFSAIDYLMKPIDPKELKNALDSAITKVKSEEEYQELLKVLQENINNKGKKIVLKTTEKKYILAISDIYRLEASGSYTIFITKNTKITVSKNLKNYEGVLGEQFVRCHQSHLINSKFIKTINKNDSLELTNGDLVPVSNRKRSNVMQYLK